MPPDQPTIPHELRSSVLEALADDDVGIYEVWWHANSVLPDWTLSARLAASEKLVEDLVREGVVEVWRGRWIGPEHDRAAVPAESLPEVLRAWSTWVPQEEEVIWLGYTSR